MTFDNPLVTQTVEVMNQTEFIQTLLDTYASDAVRLLKFSTENFLLTKHLALNFFFQQSSFLSQNEGIFMPHIDLTPDTTANLVSDEKFLKPLWYIPPQETEFTKGIPTSIPKISKPVVMEAIRASLSGLVRLKGFNGEFRRCADNFMVNVSCEISIMWACGLSNVESGFHEFF